MTIANFEADGAPPSGADLRVWRPAQDEAVAALQLAFAAVLALSMVVVPHDKAPAVAATPAPQPIAAERLISPSPPFTPGLDAHAILQNLLRQAGLRPTLDPHRLSWDQARRINALLPSVRAALDGPQPFRLDIATGNGREALRCLTQAAYYEAGASGSDAEAAVAQVVLNRVRHPDFPKSVCGVVYQGAERQAGCQFTFTCDGALQRPLDQTAWNQARRVAERALGGYVVRPVGAATYYHADYVFPAWAPSLQKMATVGPHIFYRMAGSQGAASFLTGRYAGGELKLVKAILKAADHVAPNLDDKAQVTVAETRDTMVPAGLKTQSDRPHRIHEVLANQARPPEAKIETAEAQVPPAAAPTTPVASVPAA